MNRGGMAALCELFAALDPVLAAATEPANGKRAYDSPAIDVPRTDAPMMRFATATCFFLVLTTAGAPAAAQEPVILSPGNAEVNASVVRPATDSLRLIVRSAEGKERVVSDLVRATRATRLGDVPTWTIVQTYTSERGTNVDRSIIRRADLAPLRYSAHLRDGEVQQFSFDGARVRGVVEKPDSAPREVDYTLDAAPYNGVVDEEVVRALPLEMGYAASFASYNPPWPPPEPTAIRVTGTEVVATAAGPVDAWVLSYAAGGAPSTIWISKSDRRVLRLRSQLRGGNTFWRLPVSDIAAWRDTV